MSTYIPAYEWTDPLRALAPGVSLATLFVVPTTNYTTIQAEQKPVQEAVEVVSILPDGAFDLRIIHLRTVHGLETPGLSLTTHSLNDSVEGDNIPQMLRDMSGLPIEALASLAHVSRNAYYKWLDGKGVSDEHITRLNELLDTFRTLQNVRGPTLKEFLETPGPAGKPIDLLAAGDISAVIGLALRSSSKPMNSPTLSESARQASNLPGWLRPVSRLNWGESSLTDAEHDETLDQLSPGPLSNETEQVNNIDEEDEAFVAWGFIVE